MKKMSKSSVCAIVVAAGQSLRMNGLDKTMVALAGKAVLTWSIEALQNSNRIDRIVLVNSEKNKEQVECLRIEQKWTKVAEVCTGGKRRQDSVAAGLKLLGDCEWVLIHDGARPLLTVDLIERGLEAAKETGAAVAAVPVTDTIKLAGSDMIVVETPPRSNLWAVQTPQVFRSSIIRQAYQQIRTDATDDATLVEQAGYKVKLYPGSNENIKITTPGDLSIAEMLLKDHAR